MTMTQESKNHIVARLSADLLQARKDGDAQKKEILQSTLTRITNAEAVAIQDTPSLPNEGAGVGSTEATRRTLSEPEIRNIIQDELDELTQTIAAMSTQPDHPYVRDIKAKSAILSQYLQYL